MKQSRIAVATRAALAAALWLGPLTQAFAEDVAADAPQNGAAAGSASGASPRAQAVIVPKSSWQADYKESETQERLCGANEVWVGRHHVGDENGRTKHLCAKATQFDEELTVEEGAWSGWINEPGSRYTCPVGTVIVGRKREANKGDGSDERGRTSYKCSGLTDTFGYPIQVIAVGDYRFNGAEHEGREFKCDNNEVLIGRTHDGDEKGDTYYKCANLY